MRSWPLRRKLALWSALVTGLALLTFGGAAAINLHLEQAEARSEHPGSESEPPEDSVSELLSAYLFSLPVVVVVVAAGSWWMARRALQPFVEITSAAAAITADRLDARLPEPPSRDEIGRHVRVLNEMFDRLQRSFEQARRFAADASHELRTPLTILRGGVEEELRQGTHSAGQEAFLTGLLEQIGALQQIAANLLLLAQFDAGKAPIQAVPVDFSRLVGEAAEDAEMLATPRQIKVLAEIAPGLSVVGDAILLRRLLLNLVDNAVRYNRPEGTVRLRLQSEGGRVSLAIANTGPGIPPEQRAGLFKRFSRIDQDRNRQSGGSGLGLSLCREIAVAHAGTIAVEPAADDLTEFRLTLPLAGT